MNRFRFRMMVYMVLVLMLGVRTATRGDDKAVGRRPIRASETLGAQRYAVIIGVNDYRDEQIPDLTFAEGDARAVYDVLTDPAVGGIDKQNATLLVGKTATTRNIRKALAELHTIPKDATVFIFFSGHGAKESGEAFWVTEDSELGSLAATAMSNFDLQRYLSRVASQRLIMLLDCCYAAATVKENKSVVDLGDVLKKFVGKGRVTITASGSGEEAIEAHDLKRGVFTYYLLEALRGAADGVSGAADGIVTVPELTAYIDKTVAEAARRRKGIQKPAIFMEEVQDPAKFLVTIDPAKMASLAEAARRQGEQVKARIEALKRLAIEDRITVPQHSLGKRLMRADPQALDAQDRERLGYFVDMLESKLDPKLLQRLLDSVETPAERAAREKSRMVAGAKSMFAQRRFAEAEALAAKLTKLDPENKAWPELLRRAQVLQVRWWIDKWMGLATALDDGFWKPVQFARIARVQAETGDIAGAKQTASTIKDAKQKSRALSGIVKAQAETGDIAGAKQTASGIEYLRSKVYALTAIAKAQAKAGDMDEARNTFARFKQTSSTVKDANYKSLVLLDMARAQAQIGDIAAAKQTASRIERPGTKVYALTDVARAQAKAGDMDGAKGTYRRAEKAASKIEDQQDRSFDLYLLTMTQAETGDIAGAKQTASAIEVPFEKARALTSIAEAQAKAGDMDGARDTFGRAKQAASKDERREFKLLAFRDIVVAQAEAGDMGGARETIAQAERSTFAPESAEDSGINGLVGAMLAVGDLAGATHAIAQMRERGTDPDGRSDDDIGTAWRHIVEYQVRAEDFAGAIQTASELGAIKLRFRIDAWFAFFDIAEAQAKKGDMTGARKTVSLARSMDDHGGLNPDARMAFVLSHFAFFQASDGDMTGAADTLLELSSLIDSEAAAGERELDDLLSVQSMDNGDHLFPYVKEHVAALTVQPKTSVTPDGT